jgi:hypothetical protein
MTLFIKSTAGIACFASILLAYQTPTHHDKAIPTVLPVTPTAAKSTIQVAILLDVSNSMDGLINQAKAQLWNMVSVMGKASCNGATPNIEIALYEYGRPANNAQNGYVKQISGFTTDLDKLSQQLFGLTTNGGDEYCGHVIYNSLNELNWDTAPGNYRVIFIAGNEDFLQGDIAFTKACLLAKQKGVIVNTIYCGSKAMGIQEHWNLGGECGNGSYTNINENAKEDDIETPYDSLLFSLNDKLNSTYIGYGRSASVGFMNQEKMDVANMKLSTAAGLKRITVKGKKNLYKNSQWDMVDAYAADSTAFAKMSTSELPDSLQKKSKEEIKNIINTKTAERTAVQNQIGELSGKREAYITVEKAKKAVNNNQPTLETEIEKIIREQARRFNMLIQ